jgi:hypothetical protein
MSYTKLLSTINNIENKPIPGVFDISSMLLPTNEVVKNILVMEDNLPIEDAELLVNGFVSNKSNRRKSESQRQIENFKNEGDTRFKNVIIDNSVNNNIKEISDTDTGAPLSSKSPYHKKAKEILSLIKEKVTQFFRKVKELIKEIASVVISISTSIPGAALMVSPFAFNVPGMITMIMQMIHLLSMLSSKVADLVGFFKYFKMLHLVLSPKDLNKVSSIINTSYQSVSKAFKPLDKSISSFISIASKRMKSKSDNKKAARYITSRLRKLKYIEWSIPPKGVPPFNRYITRGIQKVDEDDRDEVEEILEQWEVVFPFNKKIAVKRKKMFDINGNELNIDNILNDIDKINDLVDDIKSNLPEVSEEDDVIYDVRFSDGRTLFGLNKEDIDGLKSIYSVIYSENVKYSFI